MGTEEQGSINATVGAESNVDGDNNQNQNQQGPDAAKQEQLVISEEELQRRLQVEGDKRVREAMETHKPKWEAEAREREKKARADAERLAKLSAEEREKEQVRLNREELTQKEKDLHQREMKLAAIDILAEEKLPVTFADQLIGSDVDDTYDRITKFKKAWHEAVEVEVKERLKGIVPDTGDKSPPPLDMNAYIRRMAGSR